MSVGQCTERKRLAERLRIATHELSWVLTEEVRLASEEPERLAELCTVVESAGNLRRQTLRDFVGHLVEHGCEGPGSLPGWIGKKVPRFPSPM